VHLCINLPAQPRAKIISSSLVVNFIQLSTAHRLPSIAAACRDPAGLTAIDRSPAAVLILHAPDHMAHRSPHV
jgi:hypothetical protein